MGLSPTFAVTPSPGRKKKIYIIQLYVLQNWYDTACIDSGKHLNYSGRLEAFNLYSFKCRRNKYLKYWKTSL